MPDKYTLLNLISLDPGSWADWFSGSMSAIAVTVALGGYGVSEWQHRRVAKENNRRAANQVGMKIFATMNGIGNIHRHLSAEYTGVKIEGPDAHEIWRTIQPLVGLTDDPSLFLESTEINFLIDAKQHDYLTNVMLAITRHRSLIASMREYQIKYEAVYALTPPPVDKEGGVFRHELTAEQYWQIKPYTTMLESLAQSLRKLAEEDFYFCKKLAKEYKPIMKEVFNAKTWMSLEVIDNASE